VALGVFPYIHVNTKDFEQTSFYYTIHMAHSQYNSPPNQFWSLSHEATNKFFARRSLAASHEHEQTHTRLAATGDPTRSRAGRKRLSSGSEEGCIMQGTVTSRHQRPRPRTPSALLLFTTYSHDPLVSSEFAIRMTTSD
jgi:hypothetical protein